MLAILLTACGGTSPEGTGAEQPAESGGAAGQTTGAGATTTAATGAGSSGAAGGAGAGGATSSGTGGAGGAPVDPGSMTSDSRIYAANGDEYVIDDVGVALGDVLAGGGIDNVILTSTGEGAAAAANRASRSRRSCPRSRATTTRKR